MRKGLFLLIIVLISWSLSSQEYWKDFFFFNDPQSFDRPPYQGLELSLEQAKSSGTYTEVLFEEDRMVEALSYVQSNPEYLYSFYYNDQNQPLIRISYYIDDFLELYPLNELFYHYDQQGLYAVTFLEYDLFDRSIKTRQFTKVREGNRLSPLTDYEMVKSEDLIRYLSQEEKGIIEKLPPPSSILISSLP